MMVDPSAKPISRLKDEDNYRAAKYDEAWNLGKRHKQLGLSVQACPYPSGTTASAAYWLGYSQALDET